MSSCDDEKPSAPSRIACRTSSCMCGDLVGARRPVRGLVAHDVAAHGGVADVAAGVDAQATLEPAPEVAEAAALPAQALAQRLDRHAFDPAQHLRQPVAVAEARRRQREAAVAGQHGGHAVPRRRRRGRIPVELRVVVGVHVDEARREHQPVGVDHPRRLVLDAPDAGDAPLAHADVGGERRHARAVDDAGGFDQQIEGHGRTNHG